MTRTVVLCLLSLVLAVTSVAAPFEQWFAGTSPRGAQVRVWGWGDEYSVRYETEDGHAVVYDETVQAYFYARQDRDGALVSTGIAVGDETDADRTTLAAIPLHLADTSVAVRETRLRRIAEDDELTGRAVRWTKLKETTRRIREAKEKGLLMAPPKRPTIGTARGLTLLVDFPISGSKTKTTWSETHPKVTAEDLEKVLNGDGEIPYGNATSVRGYYKDMSNGRLDYQNIVIGPIKLPNSRSTYDVVTKSCGTCARSLIGDALTALKNDANYESKYLPLLKTLDVEAGKVRLLNVWFAGDSAAKWDKGLWAHKSSLDSTTAGKLTFTNDKGETIKFDTYQITPVTTSPSIYTFCHENGHMLCGFPDLYSYDKDEENNAIGGNGVGYFSIMNGSPNKTNPIGIDAYLRTAAGWLEPKALPHGGGTVTVKANGTDVWRYDNPNDPNQYYLIENRQQKGHDESIRGSGILVWRCDEAGSNTHPTELTGFDDDVHRWSYELSLEQADGDYDLETDMAYTNGDGDRWDPWYAENPYSPDAFDDDSLPCARWRDASPSGLSLSDFSANGDTMTFAVAKYGDYPPNDDFANATVISSEGGGEVRSSVGATKEDGEPNHAGKSSATKSIWWRLEIPKTAKVTLSTEGSDFDTVMAVYTGNVVDALAEVASSDDAETGVRHSKVSFDAAGGDIYYVAVAGYSGAAGDIALNWTLEVVQGLPDLTFPPVGDYPYAIFLSKATDKVPTFVFKPDDPRYCTFRVRNSGLEDCTDTVTIALSLVNGSGRIVSTRSITDNNFPAGTTWVWSDLTYFNGLSLPDGQYKLVCELDSKHVIAEEIESNNEAVFEFSIAGGPTLADGIDNGDLALTVGGDDGWFGCSRTSHDGTDCVRSGYLRNSESAWLETTVSGAGSLSFWWKVSSEKSYDFLEFYIDGTRQTRISGTDGGWAQLTYELFGGEHVLRWNYVKDKSTSKGDDCGYVDQIVWTPAPEPAATPVIDGPAVALIDGYRDIAVSCTTEGAVIRYTTDGTDPTESSPTVQGGKVAVSGGVDVTLKVRAFKDGMSPSAVATARYLKKAEPGEWTTDAERVRLSAAVDGRMICVVKLNEDLDKWAIVGPILNSEQLLSWASANGVYLLKWDSKADSDGTSESATWFKDLYAQRGTGSMYNWEMCFALPTSQDTLCGYARAYDSYYIGTVKYDKTVAGMIAGFASILSANGLTPIPLEVVPVISLFDWEKGTPAYDAAVAKIVAIAAGDSPLVDSQTLFAWIGSRQLGSGDLASSEYVAASVRLNTDSLIDKDTEVEIANLVKAEGNAMTFEVNIEDDPVNVEAIKDMVEASSDLTDWVKNKLEVTATFVPGEEDEAGQVTITPVGSPDKAFMRVVIPKDPGAKSGER